MRKIDRVWVGGMNLRFKDLQVLKNRELNPRQLGSRLSPSQVALVMWA